jgi:quinol monooxygenase YgiN
VEFTVDSEHREVFREALRRQAENSIAREADCHTFHVCVDENDDNRFFLYEEYTSRAAFDAHLASTHFHDFSALIAPWVTSRQVAGWYRL